ncbi:MAG: hypothetical protein BroJett013_36460 [Alphaproteobacteria bacterium]|nr:MAG: hypothetical protein BroJett013_36460 [Alphaproteobacteria bacterium]
MTPCDLRCSKAHSAEYQSQALIDLAFRLGKEIEERAGGDWDQVQSILLRTSHHTHYVIGTGSNDPQKFDPNASRETLDHSIMYILAVALQDRRWHHELSYAPERARRADTVRLWRKVQTSEDPRWTERYHSTDPSIKAFGGEIVVTFADGSVLKDEIAVADAHPLGAKPFGRADYVRKFRTLAEGLVEEAEQQRFLELAQHLPSLKPDELAALSVVAPEAKLRTNPAKGIF